MFNAVTGKKVSKKFYFYLENNIPMIKKIKRLKNFYITLLNNESDKKTKRLVESYNKKTNLILSEIDEEIKSEKEKIKMKKNTESNIDIDELSVSISSSFEAILKGLKTKIKNCKEEYSKDSMEKKRCIYLKLLEAIDAIRGLRETCDDSENCREKIDKAISKLELLKSSISSVEKEERENEREKEEENLLNKKQKELDPDFDESLDNIESLKNDIFFTEPAKDKNNAPLKNDPFQPNIPGLDIMGGGNIPGGMPPDMMGMGINLGMMGNPSPGIGAMGMDMGGMNPTGGMGMPPQMNQMNPMLKPMDTIPPEQMQNPQQQNPTGMVNNKKLAKESYNKKYSKNNMILEITCVSDILNNIDSIIREYFE